MKHKSFCIFSLLFVFSSFVYAQQNEIIIPVIKSPYYISSPKWDKKGESFSYTTNGNVYVRDFLSLELQNSFSAGDSQITNPFYASNSSLTYPNINYSINNNSLLVTYQKSALSDAETKEITLPETVKNAAVNKNLSLVAGLGIDGKAFVYDVADNSIKASFPYNSSTKDIYFTNDDNVILCDSHKNVSVYSVSGQKLKTFTCSSQINGFNISPDNENVIIYDVSGTLNFFNYATTKQYGYSPSFNTKNIEEVQLTNDSKRILIKTKDNLYATSVSDILYALNNIPPKIKQFYVNYNITSPKSMQSNITEFQSDNVQQLLKEETEYIISVKEKQDDVQNFDLQDPVKKGSDIALIPKAEDKFFPASPDEQPRTENFSNKTNVIQNSTTTKSFVSSASGENSAGNTLADNGLNTNANKNLAQSNVFTPTNSNTSAIGGTPGAGGIGGAGTAGSVGAGGASTAGSLSAGGASTGASSAGGTGSGGSGAGSDGAGGSGAGLGGAGGGTGSAGFNPQNTNNSGEINAGEDDTKKDKDSKTKKKEEQSLKELLKDIHEYEDEDIRTLFKDGHGLLFNIGAYKSLDPYPLTFMTLGSYRNYDLIRPFYFGGTLDLALSIPSNNFSFSYTDAEGNSLNNPFLVAFKVYAPIGFCIYPLRNSFEVFLELGFGMSFSGVWSGGIINNFLMTKLYPAFYTIFRTGVVWDFLNLSLVCSYDAILGFNYGIELGAIINIGGSRSIGNLILKKTVPAR